jgi:hypothetical protein
MVSLQSHNLKGGDIMGGIVLRILLHGLIALVPTDNSSLTALVVDGTNPPAEASKCVGYDHKAQLLFTFAGEQATAAAACKKLNCAVNNSTCICTFDQANQYQVSFDAAGVLLSGGPPKKRPDQPMPKMQQQAGDPSYLVDIQPLAPLDLTFLTTKKAAGLLGRMQFPYTKLTACNLALVKDGSDYFAHTFNVRKLDAMYDPTMPLQALAQALMVEADIPSGSAKLKLEFLGGGSSYEFDLAPEQCDGQTCFNVYLVNHRTELPEGDPCVTYGIGFDFAYYYQLTQNAPAWKDRPIPQVDSVNEPEGNVALPACSKVFAPHYHDGGTSRRALDYITVATSRPVCAMAFFN